MKQSKTLLKALISLLLILNVRQDAGSCGWYEPDYDMKKFFASELSNKPLFEPFYFNFSRLYSDKWYMDINLSKDDNLNDWVAYCNNKVAKKDIDNLLYMSDALENTKDLGTTKYANNAMYLYLAANKDKSALDYLYFMKKCSFVAGSVDEWEENASAKNNKINQTRAELLTEGEKLYKQAKNKSIKLRLGYQLVRLAHYSKEYQQTIKLYDKYVEPNFDETQTAYWAMGHKAGAIYSLGEDRGLSGYLFSRMFEKSPAKRVNAYYSFKILEDKDWQRAMSLCKNNKEKATLHFLRSINPHNVMLEELKSIYALDNSSDYLDILLVRELNKLEQSQYYGNEDNKKQGTQVKKDNAQALKVFIQKILAEGKLKNPALFTLGLGYCDYMVGNNAGAKKSFANIPESAKTNEVKAQITIFELMLQLTELQKVGEMEENKLFADVNNTKSVALKGMLIETFAKLYKKQNNKAQEYLSTHKEYSIQESLPNLAIVEDLITFSKKPNHTAYEKKLLANIKGIDLQETKGMNLLKLERLEDAITAFKLSKSTEKVLRNPLKGRITPYFGAEIKGDYTRLALAEKMLELKKLADKGGKNNIAAMIELGNTFYNISYYGYSWNALAYSRSGSSYNADNDFLSMKPAKRYYEKALKEATASKNKEFAAQSCFMLAKCQQNEYYFDTIQQQNLENSNKNSNFSFYAYIDPNWGKQTYLERLKKEYENTEFYHQAIKECFYMKAI